MRVRIETDEPPASMLNELETMGIVPVYRRNAPVARPKPKKSMTTAGWKPSYKGEEPPW